MQENTIVALDEMPERLRARFLSPIIVGSMAEADSQGKSLALLRPRNVQFIAKRKSAGDIKREREGFRDAARQRSLFGELLGPEGLSFWLPWAERRARQASCAD